MTTVTGLGIARGESWQGKVQYRIFRGAITAKRITSPTRHDVYNLESGHDCTRKYHGSWRSRLVAWHKEGEPWVFLTDDPDIRSTIDKMLAADLSRWPPPPAIRPYDPEAQQP